MIAASAACLEPARTIPETAGAILSAGGIGLAYANPAHTPATRVLEDFSLRLQTGEIVALLGPSGVGKSSLLRALAGLQTVQAGEIRLHGRRLDGPDPALGFVFQDPCLLPWLTLEENVAFGLDFRHQPRLDEPVRRRRVRDAIAEVGLWPARKRYPDELSGGMAQRASLARCLARAPEVLLLDEPFSALDEVTRGEMQGLLSEIIAKHRTAAILVTHDIDEALLLGDRILLVGGQPGRLMREWRPDCAHPRDVTAPRLTALRVDILQTLRTARAINTRP